MSLGSSVRGLLGRYEPLAIRLYRDRFIDLDALATTVASVAPGSGRVLEIGCGDGALAEALLRHLPFATVLGIDPGVPEPGRMFGGDRRLVTFETSSTSDLIARAETPFDLVSLVDVLHHVADNQRQKVLEDAASLTAPGGTLIVKEWELRDGLATERLSRPTGTSPATQQCGSCLVMKRRLWSTMRYAVGSASVRLASHPDAPICSWLTVKPEARTHRVRPEHARRRGRIDAGSITHRYTRCGTANCRCHADPPQPHGPYWQWTAKIDGKTVTRRLRETEARRYQQWIDNDRQLRTLIERMRAVAAKATELIMKDTSSSKARV